jgi:hypothetical protein
MILIHQKVSAAQIAIMHRCNGSIAIFLRELKIPTKFLLTSIHYVLFRLAKVRF